jgi:altronate dehydratase small subunit
MERKRFIVVNAADNVGTAIADISAQERLRLPGAPASAAIAMREPIPFGHKFALVRIVKGQEVIKYGQTIGRATADIEPGCHVHVHNVESLRGRGDLGG